MPWCEACSKFWNPNTLPPDGTCPTCGRVIAEPPDTSVPWHFWLLVGAVVLYLGWRLVQGFQWLAGNDHGGWAIVSGVALVALVGLGAWWNWRPEREDAAG
jgi:uncharacterized paraquat-inducible protein A